MAWWNTVKSLWNKYGRPMAKKYIPGWNVVEDFYDSGKKIYDDINKSWKLGKKVVKKSGHIRNQIQPVIKNLYKEEVAPRARGWLNDQAKKYYDQGRSYYSKMKPKLMDHVIAGPLMRQANGQAPINLKPLLTEHTE